MPRNQLTPPPLRPAKSTSNLVQPKAADPSFRKSTPAISSDPRGAEQGDRRSMTSRKEIKKQEKEQKKQEKQRLADQRKQAQEQAKREKLIKEQAKKEAQKAKAGKKVKKTQAPTAPTPSLQPQAQPQSRAQTLPQTQPQPQTSNPTLQATYSTNTLDSSISRSSGPPPYSEMPKSVPAGGKDKSGNVAYSKPVDAGSWDIISQHREQISRPAAAASADGKRKQMVMDLNYNFGETNNKVNSNA